MPNLQRLSQLHKALLSDDRYRQAKLGGQDIFVGHVRGHLWPSGQPNAPKILVLPGFTEYCEKYAHIGQVIHQKGYDSLTIDWPGQGLSGNLGRDDLAVHIDDFADHLTALKALLVKAGWHDSELHILAHSMGGHLAIRVASLLANQVQSVALSTPMMVPVQKPIWAIRSLAWLLNKIGFARHHVPFTKIPKIEDVQSFIADNPLTKDEAGFAWQTRWFFEKPELRRFGATNGWVGAAYGSAVKTTLNPDFLQTLEQPFLLLAAADETIIDNQAIEKASHALPNATYYVIADARHELFNERPAAYQAVWAHIDAFWSQHIG